MRGTKEAQEFFDEGLEYLEGVLFEIEMIVALGPKSVVVATDETRQSVGVGDQAFQRADQKGLFAGDDPPRVGVRGVLEQVSSGQG